MEQSRREKAHPNGQAEPPAKPVQRSQFAERKRQTRLAEVEQQISDLEEQLRSLERRLENPPADPAKVQQLGRDYLHLQASLDGLMQEWEALQES
jgi:TolA-binding protein